jgi:hypothetical protein
MEGVSFSGSNELARCLRDAEACAEACEELLETVRRYGDTELQRRVVGVLVAPAAISRVLLGLVEHPPQLVLAACRLCRDSAHAAIVELEPLDGRVELGDVLPALRDVAGSCEALLAAEGP